MYRIICQYTIAILGIISAGCTTTPDNERALDPWVIRLNLDDRPRMIALALNRNMYAAYDAQYGSLYQVWKGDIKFTGPVFDNIHGQQPSIRGEAYIKDDLEQSPWSVRTTAGTNSIVPDYQGYSLKNNKITLHYHLHLSSGETIEISESPEYIADSGKPGFERKITVSSVPNDADVLLQVSFMHLASQNDLQHDGVWKEIKFSEQSYPWGSDFEASGTLILNANGSTTITGYFESKATEQVKLSSKNNDKITDSLDSVDIFEDSNDLTILTLRGKEVIGNSDCAACHNMDKALIGPSYAMISQKYQSSIDVVEQLSDKIINGGSGVWGTRAMSAHPLVTRPEAKAMAAYILSVVSDNQASYKPGVAVDFYDIGQPLGSLPEVVAGQSPNVSEVFENIDFRSGNPDIGQDTDENFSGFYKDFVMQVNGFLNVPESDTYDLQFVANNGGKLELDGEVIFEGHFYEGTFIEGKEVYLEKGAHKLKIDFYHHLFDKYLILMWREDESAEYEPIPASMYTHNPFDILPTAPGIKELVRNSAPGFGASLDQVHPAFDLSPVRPEGFEPRVGDISFMEDGSLVLCTWDGEVYILDNATSSNPEDITVRKIADGLCEPLGIAAVDGEIYVLQRWELTKLIDHDGDGITDEYKSISDKWGTSPDFHEWSFGLIYRDGFFYAALGIAQGRFHDEMPADRGKAIKISKADGSHSFIAHGLKEPNGLGFGVDGEIFATDNEGEYVPICKMVHLPQEGYPFYGVMSNLVDPPADLKEKPPVIWFPQNEIGNSPSQPIMLHYGPYEGQMIHGEITHGGIKRDFVEKVKGQYQGAVFRFSQGLEVGINRLEWGPDGALYAAGLGGAQDFGHQGHQFGLQRLTYNGNPAFEMLAIRAKSNGLEVEFTKPLRVGDGTVADDYLVQQWYYSWTGDGSSQSKKSLETLKIRSVTQSENRRKVFLEIAGMKKEHVLYVQLQPVFLSEDNDQLWSNEGWYTLNEFPDDAGMVEPSPYSNKPNSLSTPEIELEWALQFDGQSKQGWHSAVPSDWTVKNGELSGQGSAELLLTDRNFNNFELELQWKLTPGAEGGLLFNIPAERDGKELLSVSPRVQLIDDRSEDAKSINTHKSGANYDVKQPEYVVTKPSNQYNSLRLVVENKHVEHWINGIKVLEYHIDSREWKEAVQASGYADKTDYGLATNGLIGLYVEKGRISFRNFRVRDL